MINHVALRKSPLVPPAQSMATDGNVLEISGAIRSAPNFTAAPARFEAILLDRPGEKVKLPVVLRGLQPELAADAGRAEQD